MYHETSIFNDRYSPDFSGQGNISSPIEHRPGNNSFTVFLVAASIIIIAGVALYLWKQSRKSQSEGRTT